jgi:hypothetical protein
VLVSGSHVLRNFFVDFVVTATHIFILNRCPLIHCFCFLDHAQSQALSCTNFRIVGVCNRLTVLRSSMVTILVCDTWDEY